MNGKQTVREHHIPEASIARLPVYLRCLSDMAARDIATVSSDQLADAAGVNSAKVRKDFSHLGSYGTRGVGYDVGYLMHQIRRELGLEQGWNVVIVGMGHLGTALAHYRGFGERGFNVVGLLDVDAEKVGERVRGQLVEHLDDLDRIVKEHQVAIGVVATPAGVAQDVTDRLIAAGVTSILNFAPVLLQVPLGVSLRKVDLSTELQILSFHEQRKTASAVVDDRGRP